MGLGRRWHREAGWRGWWREVRLLVGCGGMLGLLACGSGGTAAPSASVLSPAGLAVAGTNHDLLFVADSARDTLQVAYWDRRQLNHLRFVRGPAAYFPLRVPVAGGATDLAATPDGRFVVVLDQATATLRLVRAASQQELTEVAIGAEGGGFRLGEGGLQPSHMVAAWLPSAAGEIPASRCGAGCLGSVYVSMENVGAIVEVGVFAPESGLPLRVLRWFQTGGNPAQLAVHPAGGFLFASDAGSTRVLRLDLASGVTQAVDVGRSPGPLAVSVDGQFVVVGRPSERDVVIVAGAASAASLLAVQDVNSAVVPIAVPECVPTCEAVAAGTDGRPLCDYLSQADAAWCQAPAPSRGLRHVAGAAVYQGIALGAVPVQVVTLGGTEAARLRVACKADGSGEAAQEKFFSQYAVVAGLDGRLRFIGLVDDAAPQQAPQVVSADWCRSQSAEWVLAASSPAAPPSFDRFFATQPETPVTPSGALAGVARGGFVPVLTAGNATGVVLLPGHQASSPSQTWTFTWEGVLPGLDRTAGGGQVGSDGRFTALDIDLGSFDIEAGADILEITTPVLTRAGCTAAATSLTILTVERDAGGRTWWGFAGGAAALLPNCFSEGGVLSYRVRAGGQFLLAAATQPLIRIKPGQVYGPGGDLGRSGNIMFALQESLGAAASATPLARGQTLALRITDNVVPVVSGLDPETPTAAAGKMPGGMLAWPAALESGGAALPLLFVSYGGSGGLLASVPTDTGSLFTKDRYLLLR